MELKQPHFAAGCFARIFQKKRVGVKKLTDENECEKTLKIRFLNDQFRQTFQEGKVLITSGVASLPLSLQITLMNLVRTFDDFGEDNDPFGEHDFGKIDFNGEPYFWKIDYYDSDLLGYSPDPTDETVTNRVLTVMRADEY